MRGIAGVWLHIVAPGGYDTTPEPQTAGSEVEMSAAALSERRPLLLIEDDADLRGTFEDIIDEAGYPLFVAASGREALARLPALPPLALVLVDFTMPEMSGLEFLTAARSRGLLGDTPVVLMTAAARLAPPAGLSGFLKKPLELDDLFAMLERYCG
jgi:CheY-like chemotaxis protein